MIPTDTTSIEKNEAARGVPKSAEKAPLIPAMIIVFLSASSMENSSNSVGEAMLMGVPVVASQVGGLPDILEDGKEGLFYDFEKTDQMVECILKIFKDDALALRLSEAERERGRQNHDRKHIITELHDIYQIVTK